MATINMANEMGKEERRLAVLRFLAEHGLAMMPVTIYLNMRDRGATFSENTVKRHLYEMLDEGLVEKPYDGKSHYSITDAGVEYLESSDI